MKKKLSIVFMIALVSVLLVGCGTSDDKDETVGGTEETGTEETGSEDIASEDKDIIIGFSVNNLDEYASSLVDYMEINAEALGVSTTVVNGDKNASKQIADVDSLISQGVDAIVIKPVEQYGIQPAVDAAQAAGIPLVMIDAAEEGYGYGVDLIIEQGVHGRLIGENLKVWLEDKGVEGNVGYIIGLYNENLLPRRDGIYEVNPDLNLLAEAEGTWSAANGMKITEDWILAHPEMNVILAMNDEMAIGAINALNAAGKDLNDYYISGVDGTKNGQEHVRAGELNATTFVDVEAYTAQILDVALTLVDGDDYNEKADESLVKLLTPDTIDDIVAE